MRRELVEYSKFLSLVLRHDPAVIGIQLDEAGWVEVSTLLEAMQSRRPQFTRDMLQEIVETNDKRRFAFSEDQVRIRASQGHSIGVDLALIPSIPPDLLFHGTAITNLTAIRENGLLRGKRDYVHLSVDDETAKRVGARHGRPIVLQISGKKMAEAGFSFFVSENGVWLTAHVPSQFIEFPEN
ncbi:MAG: RNA 2'-phosphotransferase [Planctomyces sp.]|nr:RNA 2'-phosphotransferase [Planctomyces sp.]